MAKKTKTPTEKAASKAKSLANLKPFQKGETGNAGGRQKLPEDIKEARSHNNQQIEKAIHRFFNMTRNQMRAVIKDEATPVVDVLIGSIVAKAVTASCFQRASFLLDRSGCRLPPTGALININVELQNMNNDELMEAIRQAIPILAGEPIDVEAFASGS